MKNESKASIKQSVVGFRLPRYHEIPNVGLYLEQTTKYIEEYLEPFHDINITGSMISNYVKKGLIANPVRKQYYRDQIAYLLFMSFAKSVLSLDNIGMLMEMQRKSYGNQRAYDYFCDEFENILQFVFNLKDVVDNVGSDMTDEKLMLRNTIITICHKLYLDQCFVALSKELEEGHPEGR
ncbi:MAG: DUF1836 domain-containing protein [Oscillospiraceae bacterium]|nr:DUF1836 domain-containing protein [Oscillospiraceae bacterium]